MPADKGTSVTATDLATGESDTKVVRDDFVIITDGRCYVDHVQAYGNGTAVLTIKMRDREEVRDAR